MTSYLLRVFKQGSGAAKAARLIREADIRTDDEALAVQAAAQACAAFGAEADFARLYAPDRTIVWCADRPFAVGQPAAASA